MACVTSTNNLLVEADLLATLNSKDGKSNPVIFPEGRRTGELSGEQN